MDQFRSVQRAARPVSCVPALAAMLVALGAATSVASAQSSTAFTYQGELSDGSGPVSGLHDFRFRLYTAAGGFVQLGTTLCLDNVQVTEGRFTVTLDFGDQFSVIGRHLETEVRPDTGLDCNSAAGFTILGPRQAITSVPAAAFAFNAGTLAGQQISFFQNAGNMTSGTLPAGRLAGTYSNALTLNNAGNVFAGSGSSLTSLNATNITLGTLADARIPTTIPRLNVANSFTGPTNIFAGGVGINTTATLAADLHVRPIGTATLGKVLVTPGAASNASSQLMLAENSTANLGAILRYDGVVNQLQVIGVTAGGVESAPYFSVGRDNGRVGIGANPEATLHVASGSAGVLTAAPSAVAILESAGDAHLQFQVLDGSSAGFIFGTPTRGSSAARLQFEDTSSLVLKAYLDPTFATVQVGATSLNVGDTTHFVSANLTGSLSVRETTAGGGDRTLYGPSSIDFTPTGSSALPRITFASGEVNIKADRIRPAGWGEFNLAVTRAYLGTPLDIENVGGSSGQGTPVLRLRRAAADGERLLEMTSIGGTYLGFISRDGGGVAYLGFTGLHAAWGEGVKAGELVVMNSGDAAGRAATIGNANTHAISGTLKSLTPVEPGMPAEPVYNIATSTTANAPGVLGITRYPLDISREVSADNPWAVAAVGNTNVWVVDTGKDVEPGDSLITSDVPGAAQVDDPERFEVGNIFGRAAQKVVWSEIAPGPDGKRRAFISVLLDSSVRDARPSAALQQRVQDLEARLQALEAMLGVQGQSGK